MSVEVTVADGVAEVVIDFPPVNALPVKGWYDLAAAVTGAGADPDTRVVVLAAEDATFGLPEVDRGALGAATHLARLVPQPLMRAMVYTCRTVSARQLLAFGTVLEVVPPEELRDRARALAEEIAAKDPQVIRLAKQSLNGIDPVDVKRSYRYEQGFTFELTLGGAGGKARQAFVDGRQP